MAQKIYQKRPWVRSSTKLFMVQRALQFVHLFFSGYRIPQLKYERRCRSCVRKICVTMRRAELHDEHETICYNVNYSFNTLVGGFQCIVCCFCRTDPTAPSIIKFGRSFLSFKSNIYSACPGPDPVVRKRTNLTAIQQARIASYWEAGFWGLDVIIFVSQNTSHVALSSYCWRGVSRCSWG